MLSLKGGNASMKSKILVPIDGSVHSLKAVDFAIYAAQAFGDEIILLNVQPSFNTSNIHRFFNEKNIKEYQEQLANEALDEAIKKVQASGSQYEVKVRAGVPKEEIRQEAEQNNVRLIVMGSRGLGPITKAFLGSVSYAIVHDAPCPITIIP